MKYQVCCIYDLSIETFGQPIFVAHRGSAIRSFADEVKRPDQANNLNKHPADFELWHISEFDDQTGQFTQQAPERIARGSDYKEQ